MNKHISNDFSLIIIYYTNTKATMFQYFGKNKHS